LAFSAFTLFQIGCASTPHDTNTAEGAFAYAEDLEKDDRYEEAINKFSECKNKFPYSKIAVEAELRIADIHYKKEAYLESQTAYQLFKDFHPKHPKSDYVTYRLAMSAYNQLPSTIDRDLTPTAKAIQYFNEVISSYSSSEFVKDSLEKRDDCYKRLADKEAYIANFYFIRDMYDSALRRYEGLLEKYPDRGQDEEALYRAGIASFEIGEPERAKRHLEKLLEKFPKGDFTKDAHKALEKYGKR
jgi:outer membrane protein assembly factor BamD